MSYYIHLGREEGQRRGRRRAPARRRVWRTVITAITAVAVIITAITARCVCVERMGGGRCVEWGGGGWGWLGGSEARRGEARAAARPQPGLCWEGGGSEARPQPGCWGGGGGGGGGLGGGRLERLDLSRGVGGGGGGCPRFANPIYSPPAANRWGWLDGSRPKLHNLLL